jgi:hypothetical protein
MSRTAVTKALILSIGLCVLLLVSEPSQVAVADWPWSPSVAVNDDSTGYRYDPSIAVDANGNAYAVWTDGREDVPGDEGYEWDIYGAFRPVEGNWGANAKLNEEMIPWGPYDPSVAMDSEGSAYAVWVDDMSGGGTGIYFAYRASAGEWTTPVIVDDDVGTSNNAPSIAVDASGNAYVAWTCSEDLCFSYRPAGGSWSAVERVLDSGGTGSWYSAAWPSIGADANGNAYLVWMDWRNATLENEEHRRNSDIYFAYRPGGGTWGANIRVNDDVGIAAQRFPTIAAYGTGKAYAVWTDRRGGADGPGLYFSYRKARGNWSSNIKVNSDPILANTGCPPDVAADANGNAYAVWVGGPYCDPWQDDDDCYSGIYFAYRPAGGAWGANLRVSDDSAPGGEQPSVAVDASGNAYVVWRHANDILFAYWPPHPGDWAPYKVMLPIVFGEYHPRHW